MTMIVLDARRVKAFECLQELGKAAGRDSAYLDMLWGEFLADAELMGAFTYYLDHHSLSDSISCEGYGLTDLYFYNLRMAEMDRDIGKNGSDCDKEGARSGHLPADGPHAPRTGALSPSFLIRAVL